MVDHQEGLALAAACPPEHVAKLFHSLIDSVINRRVIVAQSTFGETWTGKQWQQLVAAYEHLISHIFAKGDQIGTALATAQVPEEIRSSLEECLNIRSDELKASLVYKVSDISSGQLCDFDWKLHMVMASDKLATVREPVLLVEFQVTSADGPKSVTVELSKAELGEFMKQLDEANRFLQDVKLV